MMRGKTDLAVWAGILLWLFLCVPPVDRLFDEMMALHMLGQIPLLIFSGILAGRALPQKELTPWDQNGLSSLFFFLGSLAFWMLPVSLDGAVESSWEDILMHCNFLIAGALVPGALSRMSFAVRAAAGIYLTAMLASAAMTWLYTESLICTVYTIEMQQETGRLLLWALPVFFTVHVVTLFRGLRR